MPIVVTPTYQDASTALLAVLDAASDTSTLTSDVLLSAFGTAGELRLYAATVPDSADSAEPPERVATLPVTLSVSLSWETEGDCLLWAVADEVSVLQSCETASITARLVQSGDTGEYSDTAMRLQYRYCPAFDDYTVATLTAGATLRLADPASSSGYCFRVVRT